MSPKFNRKYSGSITCRYAFGYDPKINNYKVVRIVCPSNADTMVSEVEIYTLGSNSWRTIRDTPYNILGRLPGVFMNGVIHWLSNPLPSRSNSKFSHVLLSFNMSEEVFLEIPYPVIFEKFEHVSLDAFKGLLCMLCCHSNVGFEIWVMSDYGVTDSWTKLYTIARLKLFDTVAFFRQLRRIQSVRNGEIILLEIQIDYAYAALVFYDPKHEKARVMEIDPKEQKGFSYPNGRLEKKCYTVTYVESLVSLHSGYHVEAEKKEGSDFR
ncbi:F-box/kelch-repeat protein At3g06240-like [Papaver somniferum]|uniref:F-box/kelch-repeat protein At3g06240-like n=1 Tax=Papaver somniferum TaxID=3469 RepID=UPI000E6F96D4|nr:F-box/kelch-repeat protein At3g06240-like [Papaver somniferum]